MLTYAERRGLERAAHRAPGALELKPGMVRALAKCRPDAALDVKHVSFREHAFFLSSRTHAEYHIISNNLSHALTHTLSHKHFTLCLSISHLTESYIISYNLPLTHTHTTHSPHTPGDEDFILGGSCHRPTKIHVFSEGLLVSFGRESWKKDSKKVSFTCPMRSDRK
jgi:hypothetical protein